VRRRVRGVRGVVVRWAVVGRGGRDVVRLELLVFLVRQWHDGARVGGRARHVK
jgi:hypothetical protein